MTIPISVSDIVGLASRYENRVGGGGSQIKSRSRRMTGRRDPYVVLAFPFSREFHPDRRCIARCVHCCVGAVEVGTPRWAAVGTLLDSKLLSQETQRSGSTTFRSGINNCPDRRAGARISRHISDNPYT